MKTFYVVLAVFALLLLFIFGNVLYINRTAAEMHTQLSTLPDVADAEAAITALEDYWDSRRTVVALSKPMELVWDIDRCLIELRSAVVREDDDDLDLALRLASDAVTRMQRIEGLHAEVLL